MYSYPSGRIPWQPVFWQYITAGCCVAVAPWSGLREVGGRALCLRALCGSIGRATLSPAPGLERRCGRHRPRRLHHWQQQSSTAFASVNDWHHGRFGRRVDSPMPRGASIGAVNATEHSRQESDRGGVQRVILSVATQRLSSIHAVIRSRQRHHRRAEP